MTPGLRMIQDKSMTLQYGERRKERVTTPRKSKVVTFSLPPEMEA